MQQLTPAATAIPGYGTAALRWVHQVSPDTLDSSIVKTEPRQDGCDGIAGTQGWSQVVVQFAVPMEPGLTRSRCLHGTPARQVGLVRSASGTVVESSEPELDQDVDH